MTTISTPSIALLMTGSELMSGDTIDSNSAMIAHSLRSLGLAISRKVTVGDNLTVLVEELARLSALHDIVIINGGLGPTQDDLTAEVLSHLTGQPLVLNEQAHAHLQEWSRQSQRPINKANLKQAYLPAGCDIIPNPIGTAVGIHMTFNQTWIVATPGVPKELQPMLRSDAIVEHLSHYNLSKAPNTVRLRLFGLGESHIQQTINEYILTSHDEMRQYLEYIDLGFRVQMPIVELKIIPKTATPEIEKILAHVKRLLVNQFKDYIYGENDDDLPASLVKLLLSRKRTLVTAESCTGGTIASLITGVAGASAIFHAGYITYSNEMKKSMLNVPENVLEQYGAVSEPVVMAMAKGALKKSGANYAIAVSGIAGPSGGSAEKPVGTVCLAWGDANSLKATTTHFKAPRDIFQQYIATAGLDLIRRVLLNITEQPRYLKT